MKRSMVLVVSVCLLLIMVLANTSLAEQENNGKPSKAEVIQRTKKLQIPFIANEGQTDERVMFYAHTFGGTVFVTKNGEIVYALPHQKNAGGNAYRGHGNSHNPHINKREKGRVTSLFAKGDSGGFDDTHHSSPAPDSLGQTNPQRKRKQGTSDAKHEKGARGVVLKEEIIGGRIDKIKGEKKDITTVNDFRGNDPSKWKTNIPTYEVVTLGEVYEGIELKLKAYGNNVEKLFYVKPGADPGVIRLKLSGAKALRVNEEGQLEAETALGTVKFTKPIVYQEPKVPSFTTKENISPYSFSEKSRGEENLKDRQYIESTYVVTGNEYSFKLGDYDRAQGIVIDPLLESTYLGGTGGSGLDYGYAIAIDTGGNIYVTGSAESPDFPTTSGTYDTSYNSLYYSIGDAFVSKLNSDLTSLLASTYLGGVGEDSGNAIAINSEGNIYVAGSTGSTDFPTTPAAYNTSGSGFVSRLSNDLTSLLASTYLGNSGNSLVIDTGGNIYVVGGDTVSKLNGDLTSLLASTSLSGGSISATAIDSDGNVYVTGSTGSSNFPTTSGVYDDSFNGSSDAFVSKFNSALTSLLASTYLGGVGGDSGYAIAINSGGNIYVSGSTGSTDFPTTPGAYDTSFNGGDSDAFVSKLNGNLTSLLASTYLGGTDIDAGNAIAIDLGGNIYVTGSTGSLDFPKTPGAYDTYISSYSINSDAFVSRLSGDLTSLLASTHLGVSGDDQANSIVIDSVGNIYVTGSTGSTDFPTTPNAYDTSFNGSYDVFVLKLNGDLTNLLASTYLGGSSGGFDYGLSVTIDPSGNIYIAGWTSTSGFPTTSGVYDDSFNGGLDAFVSKLSSDLANLLVSTYLGGSGEDYGNAIAIDRGGNVYVAGVTESSDFPMTPGAYTTSGSSFISKLSGNLTGLLASTYLGGSGWGSDRSIAIDSGGNIYVTGDSTVSKLNDILTNLLASTSLSGGYINAITIDSGGNIYVTGWTTSSDFPTTPGAYDTSYNGSTYREDAFVSKLSGDLASILASTYLGGTNWDYGRSITIDSGGDIYVAGWTNSSDFPTTASAYDTFKDGWEDAFISKLSGDLTKLLVSTYLGGSSDEFCYSLTIDAGGNVYVTGETWSSDFPTTPGAYDTSFDGSGDAFVSKLNIDLTSLLASTYLGGSNFEFCHSVAIDLNEDIYVTGATWSSDFPTTTDAYDPSLAGYSGGIADAFVSKFDSNFSANPVAVFYISTNLEVDGNLSESAWDIATDVSNVVIGTTNNTTKFGVLWDSTYLYVGMKVLDDTLHNDSTYVHEDDSVEIYIDGDHNHGTTYDNYDRQFVKGWNDSTLVEQHGQKTGVLHGWAPISGGYSIELAIPWSNLGIIPTVGMTLGFSVGYNDDDNGVGRDGQAVWIGTANNWLDTSAFGDIILGEASPQTPTPAITPTPTLIYTPTSTPTPTPSSTPVVTPTLTPIPTPLTNGLEAHYMFDEGMGTSAHDSSGTGNHGAINGATWTAGKSGWALSLDGIDDNVQIPGLIGQPQNITISAWVQLNVKDSSGAEVVSLGDHVAIRLDSSKGAKGFYYDGTTWRATATGLSYAGTGWHHLVYVVDDANNIQKVYVDGVEKGSTAYTQSIAYAGLGSNTFIGRHGNGSGNYNFNGIIDDVRVYNKALNAQEVLDLYNQSSSGLVSRWKLDEGSGTHVTDSVGGNDGTINGAMWTGCELSLDGVNDYVTTTSPSSALKPSSQVAVSAWIKTSATDTKSGEVVSMGDSYGLRVKTNGSVLFFYYDGSTWRGVSTTGVNVHDGKWHHIIGQKSSSVLQVYVDGVLKGSFANTGIITYTLGTDFFIGKHGKGSTVYDFKGAIDDVRMYNKTLSDQEVRDLGFLAHYNFDEGSGTIAYDQSGNGNEGTINGATWTGCELSLDGDDYITKTNPSSALKPLSQVAISVRIKVNATDTKGGEVVSMGDSYGLRVKTDGTILFFYYDGSTWRGVSTTGVNVLDGKWHHIVGQKTGSALQVYVDGVLKGSLDNTGTITYTLGTGFFIGTHGIGNTLYDFKGTIDDVRVYGRTMSVQEVQELYNNFDSSGIMALVSRNHGDNDINFIPKVAVTPMHPAITLRSFKAGADDGRVVLTWETSGETDNAGFNLYRARRRNGRYVKVNDTLINAKVNPTSGSSYDFVDTPQRYSTYYYKLETVGYDGVSTMHDHVKVRVRR